MFRTNPNIVGYLQKKQIFVHKSPSPSKLSTSRFTPQKNIINIQKNQNQKTSRIQPFQSNKAIINSSSHQGIINFNSFKQKQPSKQSLNILKSSEKNQKSISKFNNFQQNKSNFSVQKKVNTKNNSVQFYSQKRQKKQYDSKFQSSRVEVKMCIQQLSTKVSMELRMLQSTLTELGVALDTYFYKSLHEIKSKMIQQIEAIFNHTRNKLDNLLNKNNEARLKEILSNKHSLLRSQQKLSQLKQQMNTNWRKVAAQILNQQFDKKIQQKLNQSEQIRVQLKQTIKTNKKIIQNEQIWTNFKKTVINMFQAKQSIQK